MTRRARLLTGETFRRFGDVIAADGGASSVANQGTARRFNHLAPLINGRPSVTATVCVFRSFPWNTLAVEVKLLERHPTSTQIFVPMSIAAYLVVVAQGDATPDASSLVAFIAGRGQAVAYRPGTWHHPIIALDEMIDFACIVFEDGTRGDTEVELLPAPITFEIDPDLVANAIALDQTAPSGR